MKAEPRWEAPESAGARASSSLTTLALALSRSASATGSAYAPPAACVVWNERDSRAGQRLS